MFTLVKISCDLSQLRGSSGVATGSDDSFCFKALEIKHAKPCWRRHVLRSGVMKDMNWMQFFVSIMTIMLNTLAIIFT